MVSSANLNLVPNTNSDESAPSPGDYSNNDSTILKFITEMLMGEDNLEDKPCMLHDCLALHAAEKPFYDLLGQHYPYSLQTQSRKRDWDDGVEDLTWRINKLSAFSGPAGDFDPQQLDGVLLSGAHETEHSSNEKSDKKSTARKRRVNRKPTAAGKETVDLWTLLTHCSLSVANNDHRTSADLLTQIRNHSSPDGNGLQRTAHYFADALEKRLAGASAPAYSLLVGSHVSAADMLSSYRTYIKSIPFKIVSNTYANRAILKQAENATSLHVIDFGILYGFQWPYLIEQISKRPGGPPKIRITGIELPQPGFRPAERVEETGRRLTNYCNRFNVPFEYHAVAQKWETIKYEDLKMGGCKSEIVVVNCLYRLKNIPDESEADSSPRNAVLRLIRRIKPDLFVHGTLNGTYGAPFFAARFKEALLHFSALFDMFEVNMAGEEEGRRLFERGIYGKEVMNVVACEGPERVERPETYKQWHVRNTRAGLRPVPIDRELFGFVRDKVRREYHKDFVIHEDGQWMLQGWKGRLMYAISCWRPAYK